VLTTVYSHDRLDLMLKDKAIFYSLLCRLMEINLLTINGLIYIVNNILLILSICSLLVASNLSADTRVITPDESSPSDKEIRDAVVKALLDQENQIKKIELTPLKEAIAPIISPDLLRKKTNEEAQALIKAILKKQDKQRIKLQEVVAAASKHYKLQVGNKKLSRSSLSKNKKTSSHSAKITAKKEKPKTPKKTISKTLVKQEGSPKILNNELATKLKPQNEVTGSIPVGRNQLAMQGAEKPNLFLGGDRLKVLNAKQAGISQLSKNIMINSPELQLNAVESTTEGRNKPATKQIQGWIYLGRFAAGSWENKTLDIEKQLPQVGKQYMVKATSLYVRNALPKKGKMGKVIHAFRANDKIKVLNLKGLGRNHNFYWAEILRE